jgi:hypothetical protein
MAQGRSALWHKDVRRFSLFFSLSYFVQGVTDLTSGFANQPIQYLLKEQMGLSAAQTGFFFAVIGVGWTIKPVYGLLSDFFPFAGYQRKGYLLLMSAVGASSWLTLAAFPPHMVLTLFLMNCMVW